MDDEQTKMGPLIGYNSQVPPAYNWQTLSKLDGEKLETHYRKTLETLGKASGLLGIVFRKSQNKIQDPAKLKRLIALIGEALVF